MSISNGFTQQNSSNIEIDGYKGIWFTLGQFSDYGDKYSGGLGTYTAKHSPLAIYAEEVNKTFFVYGGTTGPYDRYLLCMIGSFDHQTGMVSKPRVVYDKNSVDDPHDNPSLAIDDDGYLWVFVSGRGKTRPGFKYRSDQPYSITSFTQITEEEMTYPQPKYVSGKGFLNLFTKYTGIRELYFETSIDGRTWSDDQALASIKRSGDTRSGHYQMSGQWGNKVGFFCNWHPNGNVDLRTNLYYMETVDMGKTWKTIDGQVLDLPIRDLKSPTLVGDFFSLGENVYLKDMDYDSQGRPIGLFVHGKGHQPGPLNGPRTWSVVYWNGQDWETHHITTSDHNYDMGSLWISDDEWMVVGPTENTPQQWGGGGEIVMWKSKNKGQSWQRVKQVTKNSQRNHNYVRRVVNGQSPFMYFWADGNPNRMTESLMYFGDEEGQVWQLPYDMHKDEQTPVSVK
ncbi:BNR-4 repeat-containing protein [Membranihabitans marinus]|uniref:BNR-4 repeat-containing protein n=1 Tax=Membranihabitans marinus TaxID=1227546 RepID=UPI001F1E6437|nr:BNR-4 repeat-containing protein [Membranihabitans marinus]